MLRSEIINLTSSLWALNEALSSEPLFPQPGLRFRVHVPSETHLPRGCRGRAHEILNSHIHIPKNATPYTLHLQNKPQTLHLIPLTQSPQALTRGLKQTYSCYSLRR